MSGVHLIAAPPPLLRLTCACNDPGDRSPVYVSEDDVEGSRGVQIALQHEIGEPSVVVQCNIGASHFGRQQAASLEGLDGSQRPQGCLVLS